MKLLKLLIIGILLLSSCDDPSLNQQGDDIDAVEPVDNLIQLGSIEIAQDVASNITEVIDIIYNQEGLVNQIIENSSTNNIVYDFDYAGNNRLETITKTGVFTTQYNFSYPADAVFINYIDENGNLVEKQLFTDIQNRINRVVTTTTDTSGGLIQREDMRYQYTANFNVSRINSLADDGVTVLSYSEFTYEFNNNPFRDMSDVLRLIVFADFIPYTRYLPSSRVDYTSVLGNFVIDRTFSYNYTLQNDQFPSFRQVTKDEASSLTTSFEFFNYL
jgi:hypothetical protein